MEYIYMYDSLNRVAVDGHDKIHVVYTTLQWECESCSKKYVNDYLTYVL